MKQTAMAAKAAEPKVKTEPKVEILHVTPDIAQAFIWKNFENNRRLNKRMVSAMARDLRNGAWRHDVLDPIRFNTNGELIDGQHRLTAIINSGVGIDMLVVRDVHPESVHAIDTGKARTPGDMLRVAGFTGNTQLIASALRGLAIIKRGVVSRASSMDATHSYLRELAERHPLLGESAAKVRTTRGVRPSLVALMHYIGTNLLDKAETADAFVSVFNTGIPSYPGDVAQLYRERLLRDSVTANVKATQISSLMAMISVWNHFAKQTTVQYIKTPKEVTVAGLDIDLI